MQMADSNSLELYIYDTIQSGYYTWFGDKVESETSQDFFREQLEKYPNAQEIHVYINSNGGDVYEAYGMISLLERHSAKKICHIDGFACSAASLFLCIADKVIMSKQATVMIHNMSTYIYGNAEQLRKAADDLEVLMAGNRKLYLSKMNITEEELIEALNNETIYTAEQCLENGLADEIMGDSKIEDMEKISQLKIGQMKQMIEKEKQMAEVLNQLRAPKEPKEPDEPKENTLLAFFKKTFN